MSANSSSREENIKTFLQISSPPRHSPPSTYLQPHPTDHQTLLFQHIDSTEPVEYHFDQILPRSTEQWSAFEGCALPLLVDLLAGHSSALLVSSTQDSFLSGTALLGSIQRPGLIPHTLSLLFAALELNNNKQQAGPSRDTQVSNEQLDAFIHFKEELRQNKKDVVKSLAQTIRSNLKKDFVKKKEEVIFMSYYAMDENGTIYDLLSKDESEVDVSSVKQVKSVTEAFELLLQGKENCYDRFVLEKHNYHFIFTISVRSSCDVLSSLSFYQLAGVEHNGAWTPVNHDLTYLNHRLAESPGVIPSPFVSSKLAKSLESILRSPHANVHLLCLPPTAQEKRVSSYNFLEFTSHPFRKPEDRLTMLAGIDQLRQATKDSQSAICSCQVSAGPLANQDLVDEPTEMLDRMSTQIKRLAAQISKSQREANFEIQYRKKMNSEMQTHITRLNEFTDQDHACLSEKIQQVRQLESKLKQANAETKNAYQALRKSFASNVELKEKIKLYDTLQVENQQYQRSLAQNEIIMREMSSRIKSIEAANSNLKEQIKLNDTLQVENQQYQHSLAQNETEMREMSARIQILEAANSDLEEQIKRRDQSTIRFHKESRLKRERHDNAITELENKIVQLQDKLNSCLPSKQTQFQESNPNASTSVQQASAAVSISQSGKSGKPSASPILLKPSQDKGEKRKSDGDPPRQSEPEGAQHSDSLTVGQALVGKEAARKKLTTTKLEQDESKPAQPAPTASPVPDPEDSTQQVLTTNPTRRSVRHRRPKALP